MLFSVGGDGFDERDVVAAAVLRGEWTSFVHQVRESLSCAKHAQNRTFDVPAQDFEQSLAEFRYARNLITAEETEAWLARWNVTFDQLAAFVERSCYRAHWHDQLATIKRQYPVSDQEVSDCIRTEAICSGELDRLATILAGRAAMFSRHPDRDECAVANSDGMLISRVCHDCAVLFPDADRLPDWRLRFFHLHRMEAAFQAGVRNASTADAVQLQIDAHVVPWTCVQCRSVWTADSDTAHEVALCLRHDRETLEEVSARARAEVRTERRFIEQFDPRWQAALMSARVGDILGPLPRSGGFTVAIVDEKRPPSPLDSSVATRAEQEIATALMAHHMADVRWLGVADSLGPRW